MVLKIHQPEAAMSERIIRIGNIDRPRPHHRRRTTSHARQSRLPLISPLLRSARSKSSVNVAVRRRCESKVGERS